MQKKALLPLPQCTESAEPSTGLGNRIHKFLITSREFFGLGRTHGEEKQPIEVETRNLGASKQKATP